MKLNSFFKILNRKINKYDKAATNPFLDGKRVIVVWIEDDEVNNCDNRDTKES